MATDKDSGAETLAKLGVVPFGFGIDALRGLITSQMWGWFLVPFGLPVIGMWHAVGLFSLLSAIFRRSSSDDSTASELWSKLFTTALYLLITWGVAAIAHALMGHAA